MTQQLEHQHADMEQKMSHAEFLAWRAKHPSQAVLDRIKEDAERDQREMQEDEDEGSPFVRVINWLYRWVAARA